MSLFGTFMNRNDNVSGLKCRHENDYYNDSPVRLVLSFLSFRCPSSPHRINLRPLIRKIIDHAMEWKNTLGNILAEKTKTNLSELQMTLKVSSVKTIKEREE